MKKILNLTVVVLLSAISLYAQNEDGKTITLSEMEMPHSPAFMLLDQAPTSIERPSHVKAFALDVLSNLVQTGGLPQNYAMEVTPYWFIRPQKGANPLTFAGLKKHFHGYRNDPFAAAKEVTISLAYMNSLDSLNNDNINNLAVGARTTLLRFYSPQRDQQVIAANDRATLALLNLTDIERNLGATAALRRNDRARYDSLKIEAEKIFTGQDIIKNSLKDALMIKPVFALDVAAAYNRVFLDNTFDYSRFGRLGAWATMSYSKKWTAEKNNYLNVYGVVRFMVDGNTRRTDFTYNTNQYVDYGLKLELEFDKASLAYENLKRIGNSGNFRRSVGTIRYKLNDKMYLTGAFGENFGNGNNLVTMLGINWGFSSGKENVMSGTENSGTGSN